MIARRQAVGAIAAAGGIATLRAQAQRGLITDPN